MRILQISHKVPFPLNEGGNICIFNTTKGFFEAGHEVTLVSLNGLKHQVDLEAAKNHLEKFAKLYFFDLDTSIKPLEAFKNLFTKKSYNVIRFYHKPLENFLASLLTSQSFDIIHIESIFASMYVDVLRKFSKAPIALRQHNAEYQIWERLALNEKQPLKKWYLSLLARRLKKFESTILNKFDAVVAITENDKVIFEKLQCKKPIFVSPAGIDLLESEQPLTKKKQENPFYVYHLGSLEWLPNREAVMWFIEEVWPKVLMIDKRFKLFIAGKNMPPFMMDLKIENVYMLGEIANNHEFLSDKTITVIPLLSGSGIRLKILEAMAAKKLVIATKIGAQGIEYENGKNILIADTPHEFAEIFKQLSHNSQTYSEVREHGYQLIQSNYANSAVIKKLLDFYQSLVS
jgi:glycosyltransferase involved in cell wall biosynthesis